MNKLLLLLVVTILKLSAQNVMMLADTSGSSGDTIAVRIIINNENSFVAFQSDIQLPSELGYITNSAILSNRSSGHMVSASLLNGNVLRLIAFSLNQSPFAGNSGEVASFKVKLGRKPGVYPVSLLNPIISNSQSQNILTGFDDGEVTIFAPDININTQEIDFGRVSWYNSPNATFQIQNNGTLPLSVNRIFTTSPFFVIQSDTSAVIPPGSSYSVTIAFRSLVSGAYNDIITIYSNDPDQPTQTVNLRAVSYSINELHVGQVSGRSSFDVELPVSINNMENVTGLQFDLLVPSALQYTGGGATLSQRKKDHLVSVSQISPGRVRVISFSPTNQAYSDSSGEIMKIRFLIDGSGGTFSVNPDSVVLTSAQAVNIVSASYAGSVTISSPDISSLQNIMIGETPVTDTLNYLIQIDNYGSDTLIISSVTSSSALFSHISLLPLRILPQYSGNLAVKFFSAVNGTYSGRLYIRSNDPDEDPFFIDVTASAFAPNYMKITPLTARVGDTVTVSLQVDNYEEFVAFQTDISLPPEFQYIPGSAVLTGRKADHVLSAGIVNQTTLRLFAFSLSQAKFNGYSGAVAELKYIVGNIPGQSEITLTSSVLSNPQSQNILKSAVNGQITVHSVPATPNLIYPGNGVLSVPLTPQFSWGAADGSEQYEIQIASDSLFSNLLATQIVNENHYTSGSLSFLTKYYWRVRGVNQGGNGSWSETFYFTTVIEKPANFTLSAPANNSKGLLNPVAVSWNTSARAEKYHLQVSTSNTFNTFVVNDSTQTDLTEVLPTLNNYTEYFWRVKSVNVGGQSDWSATWSFRTLGNPYASTLYTPANNSVNQPITGLVFKWSKAQERIETIQKYQFQLATDALFTTIITNDSTLTDTTKTVNTLNYLTKYYWRVRAQNQTGWGDWSTVWNTTTIIEKPANFTLSAPANNSKGLLNPVTVSWNTSARAEKYHLQVSTSNTFNTFVVNDSTQTDLTEVLPTLSNYTEYFWRVKSVNVGGQSDWSATWSFRTLGNPYASTLYTPANNSVNQPITGLVFKWSKAQERIETIQKYQFQLATDALFTTIITNDSTLTDTTKTVNTLNYLTKYYWRVRAQNQTGWGDWSEVWNTTTIIEKPANFTLSAPANDSKGLLNPVTLTWNSSARAEKYILQVSTSSTFNTFVVNDSTQTDLTEVLPTLNNYTEYFWRVKSVNVGGQSDWSATWNFRTLGNPYASTLFVPANNSVNQPITGLVFKWSKAQERIETVQKYQFQLATDAQFTSIVTNDSTLTDTTKSLTGLNYLTKYYWRVRAQNQTGWGDWSAVWNTTTIIAAPIQVTLSSPGNNAVNQALNVALSWNALSGAETYQLQVAGDANFTSLLTDTLLSTTSKQMWGLSNLSKYYWRVRASNIGGTGNWSEVWNFTTIIANPTALLLQTPANNSANVALNVTLSWSALSGAETYQLQVAADTNFTSTVRDTVFGGTSKQMWGLSNLSKYYWRVRASNIGGTGEWSEVWNFTTIIEKPANFTLSAPANNSKGLLNPVTVSWNSSARAEKYILQVSTSSTFNTLVVNDSTQTDLTEILPTLNNYTEYFWRVKSVNIGGQSDWSAVWNFKTLGNPYASTLFTPANNSVNQPITGLVFKWSKAQERIETIQKYQFQLATDAQFTTIVTNDSTLTDTIKTLNNLSYLTKYYWRVRAQNQTGWGDWSAVWNTTTIIEKPANFTLSAPANNSKGLLNPVTVSWNSSARAEKYILQVSTSSSFNTFVLNDSTQTDLTEVLPTLNNYTEYFWRVKSVNICGQSDWSEVWNFKTRGNPYASTLYIPANNSVNQPIIGLVFKWSRAQERIETIQKYQYQLATDTLFLNIVQNDSTLTDTTKTVDDLNYSAFYYWRVRAQYEMGWGDWSAVWHFSTIIKKPENFTLISPANNSTGLLNPVTVSWSFSPRTEKFILQVSTSSDFSSFVVNDSLQSGLNQELPPLNNHTLYYWRMRAINFGGTSDWTEVWNFKTLGNPFASNLYMPANNSVNQPVMGLVFKWSKAQERIEKIQKYQFQLATDAQFTTIIQNDTTLTDTTKTVNSLSYLTQYYWRVRAQNQTGWGDWSEVWNTTTIIAAPVQVTLSSPGNNAVNQALNTSLNWNALTGAETYELQVSNDANFTSIVRDTTFGGTSKQMWGLLNSTKYYWRVRASNVGGTGSWSEVWNFTTIIAAPGQVVLSSPVNNAVNQALHVSLSWIQLSGAETYQLQVSNDANFTTVVKDTTFNGTSKQMWGLSNLTKNYWRVRASNIGGTGNWSEVWNFTTIIAAPGQITLSSPANNAVNQSLSASLTWNTLSGAETYQLQVSTNANFTTIVKDTTFGGTSKQMWGLLNLTKYYWRVRASNIAGTGSWSEVWNFTTIIAAPGQVDLSSPANNAVNQALNTSLTWNALTGAETYQLQVSTDANFTIVIKDTTFSGTSKQMWGLLNSTKYYWRVRASNIGGTGNWSGVWNFTMIIANPTSVLLQTPANNSINVALNTSLTWSALSGAETYQLQVSSDANFTTVVKDTTFGGTSKQMWGLSNSTKYYWRVRASNVGGTGSWSEVWNFTTIIAAPGQVVLSGPANNAINQALHVSLSWIQLSGAETYQLQVSTDANFTTVLKDTTFGGNSKQIWGLLNSTKYYWRVRASNVGGTGNWSEVWNFTTIIEKPANVTLSAPANNSKGLLNPVTVSWKSSARAEKYILQVSTSSTFNTFVVNDSALTDLSEVLPELNNNTEYFWRVKSVNAGGQSDWSEVWNFKTLGNPYASTLYTPANNSVNQPVTGLVFKWSRAQERIETIQKYQLQIASDSLFTAIIYNDTTLTDTVNNISGLSYLTKYWWRVRAANQTGWGDWSVQWSFTTIIQRPGLAEQDAPMNGTVNNPVDVWFFWRPAPRAEKHQIQLAFDPQFTNMIKDTIGVNQPLIIPGLMYYTQYYWRIRGINIGGEGDWSAAAGFRTLPEKPDSVLLVYPADNATGLLQSFTMLWNKSARAAYYKLQLSSDSLFNSLIVNNQWIPDTALQVSALSPYTRYFWRVMAVGDGGQSAWSAVRSFKTLGSPYAVSLYTPENNAVNQPVSGLVFKWSKASERIETVQKYQFQLSADSLFTALVYNDSTLTDTVKTVGDLQYLTKYWWRVRAANQTGWGDWSSVWSLTTIIEKPGTPVLYAPANNAKGVINPVSLTWSKSVRSDRYRIQVSTDSAFTSPLMNYIYFTDTSAVIQPLSDYTKFYWRIKAYNIGGESNWSQVWNFKTLGNPYASTLYTPANNSVNQPVTGLVFKWIKAQERIETIQKYQFQLASDSLITAVILNDSTITDTTKTVNGLSYSTRYFWRVRAHNQTGWGDWSAVWNTTTIIEKPSNFSLSAPANNSKGLLNPVTVSWNSSARAEKYILQVSTSSSFNTFVLNDSTQTDLTEVLPTLNNYTEYFWRVKSVNVGGQSDWTEVWNFKTLGNPYASTLYTPANNSVNQSVTGLVFKWSKAQERIETIQKYQFQLATDAQFTTIVTNDSTLTDTTKTVNSLSHLTKYYWRIRANNQTGWGDWSEVWNTTTIIEKPANFTLSAPTNNSKGLLNPVTVSWNSSARAEKYILQVSTTSTFNTFVLNDSTQTDLTEVLPTLNNYTEYFWRVKSVNIGGQSDWSEVWNFKTLGNPYPSTLYIPANNSVNQPVNGLVFKWSRAQERIETIQKYQFQLATDAQFTTIITNDSTLTDTTKSLTGLTYLTKYYWRVRASNQTGWGDWSTVWNTTTIIEKPANLTLSAPANNSKGLLNPVTVSWNSSARAEKYILQVSASSSFNTFVVNDSTQTDLTEVLPILNNFTEYFWRVKSVNVGGQSDWSEIWNFKTLGSPYASTLYTPANNSVNQPVTGLVFKWSKAQERIETIQKYQFQLATDSSFSAIVNNDSTVTDTSTTVNNLSYLTKYYWRVRAQNQTGWGDWSEVWNTTTIIELPGTPVLIYPENNAQNITVDPVFVWNAAPRFVKYLFQISDTADFSTIAIQDSAITDTSKSITGLQQGKVYFWRVKANNAAGWGNFATTARFTTLLTAPTQLIAAVVNLRNIQLNWIDNSTNETRYMVERKTGDTASANAYAVIADNLPANTTSFTDTAAVYADPSLRFSYRVRSANSVAQSAYSNQSSVQFTIPAPLLVSPADNVRELRDSVQLIWRSLLGSIAAMQPGQLFEYHLQVALDSLFANLLVNDSTMTDTVKTVPLADGNRYYWRVRAKMTAYGEFTPLRRYTSAINAPDSLTAFYDPEQRKVILNWLDRSSSEAGFIIERKDSTGNYVFVANAPADAQSYADAQMNLWSTFTYRIQSYNGFDSSEYAESQSVFTDIRDLAQIPEEYQLIQNYPNPFNPSTVIRFGVPHSSLVYVLLYNLQGQQVMELYRGEVSPGFYELKSDLSRLSSGIYFYRIVARSSEGKVFTQTRKLSLIK